MGFISETLVGQEVNALQPPDCPQQAPAAPYPEGLRFPEVRQGPPEAEAGCTSPSLRDLTSLLDGPPPAERPRFTLGTPFSFRVHWRIQLLGGEVTL